MVTAIVFSNLNVLSVHLVEYLLNSQCKVYVVSNEHKEWKESLEYYTKSDNLLFFEDNRYLPRDVNYVFSVNGFGSSTENVYLEKSVEQNILWAAEYAKSFNSKLAIVLPLMLVNDYQVLANSLYKKHKNKLPDNYLTTFVGEVYGQRMQLSDGGLATKIIKESVFSSVVTLPTENKNIYLIFVADAVAEIVKGLFSFGVNEKEIAITESDTSNNLFSTISSFLPDLTSNTEPMNPQHIVEGVPLVSPTNKTRNAMQETLAWLAQYSFASVETKIKESEKQDSQKTPAKKTVISKTREKTQKLSKATIFVFASLLILVFIVFSPFLALSLSAAGFKYSYNQIKTGDIAPVANVLSVSTGLAGFSRAGLSVFTGIPVMGEYFKFTYNTATVLELSGKVALEGYSLYSQSSQLSANILNDQEYDVVALSRQLSNKAIALQKDTQLLKAKIQTLPLSLRKQLPEDNLDEAGRYIDISVQLLPQLPTILGNEEKKTYLVLFQNNMELRPTGGFIGSFALVTVSHGKLSDITVHDVYTADGQLKGHIEPPSPIKDYLGEANWWLRDSNWDPDFATSAKRAEWFLEKEMDRQVDGVIGVDLEVAKSMLKQTGPVQLTDFNESIDYKNVYDKIQYEVENDFFPGSQKKTNILTSLTKALLTKITEVKQNQSATLAQEVFSNLKQKHVQVYLHDTEANQGIVFAGWAGDIKETKCSKKNCQNVLVQVNEANVGVNKANYFIERNMQLTTKLEGNIVKNSLQLNLINNAVPALGLKGKYKTYVRLVSNKGSHFSSIEVKEPLGSKFPNIELDSTDNYDSAGVLVEVEAGQTKTIVFEWSNETQLDTRKPGSLNVLWKKQAGTDPATISLGLTTKAEVRYNTNLAQDEVFANNW